MLRIRLRLRMAIRAHKNRVVGRICMAIRALLRRTVRNWEPRVIERCTCPGGGSVTSLTGCRKSGRCVIRIRGAVVIALVARVAIRRDAGVIAVHVAVRASDSCVCPS